MLTDDQIRMLVCHAERYPDSDIVTVVRDWYNAEYAALGEIEPYTVCEQSAGDGVPETIADIVDFIGAFTEGKTRRVARAAIRIACREAGRRNIIRTSRNV